MKIELLKEPYLEFGNDFICDDPKLGITEGGFFSLSSNTHRSDLHFAIIGTQNNTSDLLKWIAEFASPIEATAKVVRPPKEATIVDGEVIEQILNLEEDDSIFHDIEVANQEIYYNYDIVQGEDTEPKSATSVINKRLNPDFPGFNSEDPFHCRFVNDEANNAVIREAQIKAIIKDSTISSLDKLIRICDVYIEAYKFIVTKSLSKPEVCFLVIPKEVYKQFSSLPYKGVTTFNLRRYLKAQLITQPGAIPVQIILEDTILSTKKSLQDLSMQAWNFCVANYYKNSGTPWSLTLKDKSTCFIGISFHKVLNGQGHTMRSSVAQAFNYEGKGIVFVGDQFEWDPHKTNTPAPHLGHEYAKSLISNVIREYKTYNKSLPPTRIVIHKTTDFWDSTINSDYAEVEGLKDGIRSLLGENIEVDLVSIKSSPAKLLRKQGNYPVLRGMLLEFNKVSGLLYTTGYIPYYDTFPGVHIPHPLEIGIYEAESTLQKIAEEILALTKMNFNNCNYYNSLPITIQFAQKVGEIIQYIDEGAQPPDKYYFYM
jgi:hypothetical protein